MHTHSSWIVLFLTNGSTLFQMGKGFVRLELSFLFHLNTVHNVSSVNTSCLFFPFTFYTVLDC